MLCCASILVSAVFSTSILDSLCILNGYCPSRVYNLVGEPLSTGLTICLVGERFSLRCRSESYRPEHPLPLWERCRLYFVWEVHFSVKGDFALFFLLLCTVQPALSRALSPQRLPALCRNAYAGVRWLALLTADHAVAVLSALFRDPSDRSYGMLRTSPDLCMPLPHVLSSLIRSRSPFAGWPIIIALSLTH